ncbi:aldehyde dehydrogenase family protein, partial [Mycobacteriaceae bacterium Msp059]|nr:aldehyde dehydrogenase family protein [Mycobacteriaceae bacterium Msp059]
MTASEVAPNANSITAGRVSRATSGARKAFADGLTRDLGWRKQQLLALHKLVIDNEQSMAAALDEDLGRPPFEAWLADVASVAAEASDAAK